MITASDLRIGNLVYPFSDGGETVEILAEDLTDTSHLHPIPLTEEWLLSFGFFWDNKEEMLIEGFYRLTPMNKKETEWYFNDFGLHIKYVHSLQNLYYALTGKELTPTK